MDLALGAGISARHLSFVETGRSQPGRATILSLLEQLDVPYRERNRVLLAGGHAPMLPEYPLDHPDLAAVRSAVDVILKSHEPYPAMAVDRVWNIVATNSAVAALTSAVEVAPELLEPPINAVRASLHPRGLAPLIVDVETWRAFFRTRLERQYAWSGDPRLAELLAELDDYGTGRDGRRPPDPLQSSTPGPLKMRGPGGTELSFISMFAGFDSPFEVTTSELAVELLFPADEATTALLEKAPAARAPAEAG